MVEVIHREKLFLQEHIKICIKKKLGDNYTIKDNYIEKNYPNYPYPKRVGHYFIKDDDLYMVINEYENIK